MGRNLRSTILTTRRQRILKLIDRDTVRVLDERLKAKQKRDHDCHHGVRSLPPLNPGEKVWIPDRQEEASVAQEVGPESYQMTTPEGSYCRNRRDLIRLPSPPSRAESPVESPAQSSGQPSEFRELRRSGRTSRPPTRLDPSWT